MDVTYTSHYFPLFPYLVSTFIKFLSQLHSFAFFITYIIHFCLHFLVFNSLPFSSAVTVLLLSLDISIIAPSFVFLSFLIMFLRFVATGILFYSLFSLLSFVITQFRPDSAAWL